MYRERERDTHTHIYTYIYIHICIYACIYSKYVLRSRLGQHAKGPLFRIVEAYAGRGDCSEERHLLFSPCGSQQESQLFTGLNHKCPYTVPIVQSGLTCAPTPEPKPSPHALQLQKPCCSGLKPQKPESPESQPP